MTHRMSNDIRAMAAMGRRHNTFTNFTPEYADEIADELDRLHNLLNERSIKEIYKEGWIDSANDERGAFEEMWDESSSKLLVSEASS